VQRVRRRWPRDVSARGAFLGAVLAGGASKRFGRDKAMARLAGRRLVDRAAEILNEVCGDVVVVSSRSDHDALGWTTIPDLRQGCGPLAGLEAALRYAADRGAEGVVVLACDVVGADAAALTRLRDALGAEHAVAPARPGVPGFEPLCAVYRVDAAPVAAGLLDEGVRSAHRLLDAIGGRVVPWTGRPLVNVNTEADLQRAHALPPTVVCVVGKKKSGKTTTVVGVVQALLERGYQVMTVKHGHGFDLDREGRDSWRHRHEGGASRVVMAGPEGFAVLGDWGRAGVEPPLETLVARYLPDAEIVVVEGFKASSAARVEVFRRAAHPEPFYGDPDLGPPEAYLAVLTDDPGFRADCPVLDADAPDRFERIADLVVALRTREGQDAEGAR